MILREQKFNFFNKNISKYSSSVILETLSISYFYNLRVSNQGYIINSKKHLIHFRQLLKYF